MEIRFFIYISIEVPFKFIVLRVRWCWTVLFSCQNYWHCCFCYFCCCRTSFYYFCCCWSKHIYPCITDKTITYLRYTDDLFFVRKGIEQELLSFIQILNEKHPSITFNFKYSKNIMLLGTQIWNQQTDKIIYTSDQPNHHLFKKNIP